MEAWLFGKDPGVTRIQKNKFAKKSRKKLEDGYGQGKKFEDFSIHVQLWDYHIVPFVI